MGDITMRNLKGTLKVALFALVLAIFAGPSQARITVDAFGGELEVEGFLKSEVRSRILNGKSYLGQWINKFQVEAALSYKDIGIFDELTFVAIARPEYDIVQDMGDLSNNHIGEGTTGTSTSDRATFTAENDRLGWGGFGFIGFGDTTTGGIGKMIEGGLENPSWAAQNFEVAFGTDASLKKISNNGVYATGDLGGGGFPLVVQKASNLNLDCKGCTDLNIDNIDVATGNTHSNGRLYPFRELYADAVIGDFWIRLGKQQIVWGKTDFFRLQDLINPVDYGQHFFFDSFEDIRIPQWMASVQWKAGSWGPLTDNAIQVIWNFDEFQGIGLGNPSQFWAHPFSKDISTFAIYNTYFSVEPCVTPLMAEMDYSSGYAGSAVIDTSKLRSEDTCGMLGANDKRKPTGFGQPVGLSANLRPDWDIKNTEAGFRWEFRLADFRFAVSHWYGWNDVPVFKFHSVNLPTRHLQAAAIQANLPNDVLVGDLIWARSVNATTSGVTGGADYSTGDLLALAQNEAATNSTASLGTGTGGYVDPIIVTDPLNAAHILANGATSSSMRAAAAAAITNGHFSNLWAALDETNFGAGSDWQNCGANGGVFCSPVAGGQTSIVYKQAHTVGLAMDYFESHSGVVMRIESSWTFDEIYNNTMRSDWVDEGDVMRFSLGFDRPTFIPFLNKDRTFFLSLQIFDTWYWDHEGDKNTGMFVDEHNWITTFFFIGNYMRDKVKPIGFYVWEEASNSHVAGFNVEWLIDNHWSIKSGFHLIWGGDRNTTHDTGPFTNYITEGSNGLQNPFVTSVFGPGRQGIGSVRNYDELTFELKYQF
jgi:hypothetical protein